MRARVGVCEERLPQYTNILGESTTQLVMHVFPLDSEEALAWEAERRLTLGQISAQHSIRITLCGSRARPHFVPGGPMRAVWGSQHTRQRRRARVASVARFRWCPACARLDGLPRLPPDGAEGDWETPEWKLRHFAATYGLEAVRGLRRIT